MNLTDERINELAQKIWDYHHMGHQLRPDADCIIALGSHDLRVGERAADLFLGGYAPLVVFSGGNGRLTDHWEKSEAERFSEVARGKGVPSELILLEDKSTNTGENVVFTRRLLEERGIRVKRAIVVQKPYMERRAFATFKRHWPSLDLSVSSPLVSFSNYVNEACPKDLVIATMVGDLQRLKVYPTRGFQIAQEIPDDVWDAHRELLPYVIEHGHGGQLLSNS